MYRIAELRHFYACGGYASAVFFFFFFFFSSRRRHTRYWRDWSSDVCSSDLLGLDRLATFGQLGDLCDRRVQLAAGILDRDLRALPAPLQRRDLLMELRGAGVEGDDDAREVLVLALDGVDVAGRGLDVDACLRGHFRHLLEALASHGDLLFVAADELMRVALLLLETLEILDRGILARDQLVLFLGIQRRFLGRDSQVFLEALQLRSGALALRAALAQFLISRPRPLLAEDARVVGGMEHFLDLLQLAGQPAGARLLASEKGFEVGQ